MPGASPLTAAQKRELVERVAGSDLFQRSPKLRELFLYVAGCALDGRPEDAREQQIAHFVFNRKSDYNPGQDNIVRVEARMLRKRLETYFVAEGIDEPIVIVMPKGGYAIGFELRGGAVAEVEKPVHEAPVAVEVPQRRAWPWRKVVTVGVIALCVAAALLVLLGRRAAREVRTGQILPFSAVFNKSMETYVVTSDTSLVIIQKLAGKRVGLDDYINRQYPVLSAAGAMADVIRGLQVRNYTDAGEMRMAGKLIVQNRNYADQISIRSARSAQLPELKERNLVLIGSPLADPWGKLYYDSLPFQFDADRPLVIRNMRPRSGEQAEYTTPTQSGQTGDAYGLLALVPNFGGGSTLLIAGTTAEATCAAGDLALDRTSLVRELKLMGIDPSGPPKYFELLLRAKTLPGSAADSAVIAWRRQGSQGTW